MAMKITPDGGGEEFALPEKASLEFLQALVGGYIEYVYFDDGSALMVHEEGRLIGLPPNAVACGLCVLKGMPQPDGFPIVGTAIFFSRAEMVAMKDEEES